MPDIPNKERRGPRGHHFLVITLNVMLGVLLFWLLGFLMDDISDQPGPELSAIQKKYQDPALLKEKDQFDKSKLKLSNSIGEQHQQQTILQTSITSYKDTMNQLLDLQKASIQKGISFSPESEKNLQNVTNLYLDYQRQFQSLNESITKNNLEVQQLQNKLNDIEDKLGEQNKKADKEYQSAWENHNWLMAGLQLLVLVPLLLLAAYLYRKYKGGLYRTLFLAASIAIFLKIALVMQEYFPSYIFKYILVLALIYITVKTLLTKLQAEVSPKPDWLQKQYREGYQKNLCPVCQFAIKPSIAKLLTERDYPDQGYLAKVTSYTCPSCGELLFEKCHHCSSLRHALLHYCDNCGQKK